MQSRRPLLRGILNRTARTTQGEFRTGRDRFTDGEHFLNATRLPMAPKFTRLCQVDLRQGERKERAGSRSVGRLVTSYQELRMRPD